MASVLAMALSVVLAMVRHRPVPTSCYAPEATEEEKQCCDTSNDQQTWRPKDHWHHHHHHAQHHDQYRDDIGDINITINRVAATSASSSAPSAWAYQGDWTPPSSASSSSSAWTHQRGDWTPSSSPAYQGDWTSSSSSSSKSVWYEEGWKHDAGKRKREEIVEEEEE